MKKPFFIYCLLSLIFLGNGLTSLLKSKPKKTLHVDEVAEVIQNLKQEKTDPFEVCIKNMHIELKDLPFQYLRGLTFKNCILSDFDFDGVDLSQTNFINTQFENCNLQKAILWKRLTYSNILYFYKKAPLILIRIYSDLIQKWNKVYQNEYCYSYLFAYNACDFSKYKDYSEKANRFYQTLKTINCSSILDGLKNKLDKTFLKTVKSYNEMLSVNYFKFTSFNTYTYEGFIYYLTCRHNAVIKKYIHKYHKNNH